MADPSYLTQGEWTGAIDSCGDYGDPFNCVGGPHYDGYPNTVTGASEPAGSFPHGRVFERVVRFSLAGDDDGSVFELQSNNYHTEAELHRLRLVVNRRTGQVMIHHWHRLRADLMTTEGVITPLGIVSWFRIPGVWLWLWKTDWSAPGLKQC
jgi:hypothetical protein